ncbi:hypothetical protein KSS87_016415 [Heliosperma pusillum]|nr:hypothetical protein KSS87_016415 [Heliosperma pusillum]
MTSNNCLYNSNLGSVPQELQKHGSPDIVMALVGNKADLQERREVLTEDGIEYAEKNGMFFIETSAKTADNINQLFEVIRQSGLLRFFTETSVNHELVRPYKDRRSSRPRTVNLANFYHVEDRETQKHFLRVKAFDKTKKLLIALSF